MDLLDDAIKLHEKNISLIDGIYDILEELNFKYNLLLLAGDGRESLNFKLDNFNLRHFFSKIYATCNIGILKTNPKFYMNASKIEELLPEECIFIDDLDIHINIANQLGIKSIKFVNSNLLRRDLIENNIL